MRYRLMATYRGAPYEAGVGPADGSVVLFAACPPPEELGFEPATGHWRKELRIQDVQAVWQSRPVGRFRGERCVVLDDLGDRLHICYLGHDAFKAEQLGFWQVDRGVFELIAARDEVTDIVEERSDYPGQPGPGQPGPSQAGPGQAGLGQRSDYPSLPPGGELGYDPAPGSQAGPGYLYPAGSAAAAARMLPNRDGAPLPPPARNGEVSLPPPAAEPLPLEAQAMRAASAAVRRDQSAPHARPAAPAMPNSSMPNGAVPSSPLLNGAAQNGHQPNGPIPGGPVTNGSVPPGAIPQPAPPMGGPAGPNLQAAPVPVPSDAARSGQFAPDSLLHGPAQLPPPAQPGPGQPGLAPPGGDPGAGHLGQGLPHGVPFPPIPPGTPGSPVPPGAATGSGSPDGRSGSHSGPASQPGPGGRAESPRRRRAAGRRMATERLFSELASLAAIPAGSYSVGEEVDGAMCLLETPEGFEVFSSAGGARHEVRVFSDEESACFYLFGVLAADAVRTGVLIAAAGRVPAPASGMPEGALRR